MANANPPNEINDVEGPTYGYVVAPDADPSKQKVGYGQQQQLNKYERNREANEPPKRSLALQDKRTDLVGD